MENNAYIQAFFWVSGYTKEAKFAIIKAGDFCEG